MDTISTLMSVCFSFSVLIIWFKTNAFIEYSKLIRLDKFFLIKDYEQKSQGSSDLNYPMYLSVYSDGFFSRLLACPICLCVWMSIMLSINDRIIDAPVIFAFSLLFFKTYERLDRK